MWEQANFGEGFDIIEATDWGLLFVPAAVQAARPLVVQCHGSIGQIAEHDPLAGEETQGALVQLIERGILASVNVQTYSGANARFWGKETGRGVQMIRPAWEQTKISTPPSLSNCGLVIGRVQKWKGPETLCKALQQLGSTAPSIDWIGRDTSWETAHESATSYLSQAYPNVWGRKISRHDAISPDEVRLRQAGAMFNLVPSTWDVFNFTTIEAMASGRPSIVSDGAGASELIEDGKNGYVFPSEDAPALASAIERVLSQNAARQYEMGRAAQETIISACNPAAIASAREVSYRAAISSFESTSVRGISGWLGDICKPTDEIGWAQFAFLDRMPLRTVAKSVLRRTQQKGLAVLGLRGASR
jgi:hypothetical protein